MKVRCIANKRSDLRPYEYEPIVNNEVFGRFGVSALGHYDEIEVGAEYLVMGIIVLKTYQAYLIDETRYGIHASPCQLFDVVDGNVPSNWSFRPIDKSENIYPFVQAVIGYPELCFDKKTY